MEPGPHPRKNYDVRGRIDPQGGLASYLIVRETFLITTLYPIYLFADSQLLFWRQNDLYFLNFLSDVVGSDSIKAAYIGASNGDRPEFYSLFVGAMANIGVNDCRMIRSAFPKDDRGFLETADIILLAGGDVKRGWDIFQSTGLKETIARRYQAGAVLIGISAGAIQLGLCGYQEAAAQGDEVFDTFQIVPYIIGVHDEKKDWESLRRAVLIRGKFETGIGVPTGGGMIYHADQTIEPIRYPLYEYSVKKDA